MVLLSRRLRDAGRDSTGFFQKMDQKQLNLTWWHCQQVLLLHQILSLPPRCSQELRRALICGRRRIRGDECVCAARQVAGSDQLAQISKSGRISRAWTKTALRKRYQSLHSGIAVETWAGAAPRSAARQASASSSSGLWLSIDVTEPNRFGAHVTCRL